MKGRGSWPPSGLEEWRRRRGLSGRRLAKEVPCSANYISLLELGRTRPSQRMRERLAEILKVPAEAIFPDA